MKQRVFVVLAGLASVAALVGAELAPDARSAFESLGSLGPRERPSPLIGQPAPAFALPRLDAAAPPLASAQLLGKVWVLNVWASWCAPCREEHPLLVQAAREGGVLLVGLATRDDPRAVDEWLRRLGDPYATMAVDRDGRVGTAYGVVGVPQTFVIDQAGVVRFTHVGPLTAEVWGRQVLPLVRRLEG